MEWDQKICHYGINGLGAGIDPGQYLQTPSQCAVEGQRQDSKEVCELQIQCKQSFVSDCSDQGQELVA